MFLNGHAADCNAVQEHFDKHLEPHLYTTFARPNQSPPSSRLSLNCLSLFYACKTVLDQDESPANKTRRKMFIGGLNWETTDRMSHRPYAFWIL